MLRVGVRPGMEGSSPERGPPRHRSDSLNGAPWLRRKAEEAPGRAMGSTPLGTLTGEAGSVSLYWLSFWRCPLDSSLGFGFFFPPFKRTEYTGESSAEVRTFLPWPLQARMGPAAQAQSWVSWGLGTTRLGTSLAWLFFP